MNTGLFFRYANVMALVTGLAVAQAPPKPLEFEVATIKPHPPGDNSSSTRLVNGGINATNVTLRQLILRAYDLQEFQLMGGPGWMNDDRWDIMARTPEFVMPQDLNSVTDAQRQSIQEQMQERLRNLLKDRFQLTVHRETKEQQIYVLLVAKNGPKLPASKETGSNRGVNSNMSNGRGTATFTAATSEVIAQNLARRTGRPVVDKTGLTGRYDFKLEWTADAGQPGALDSRGGNASEPLAPTIFTAIQEQLGLKLESQKGPVEVVVIDKVERPSEN